MARTLVSPQAQDLLNEDFLEVLRTRGSLAVIVVDDPVVAVAAVT